MIVAPVVAADPRAARKFEPPTIKFKSGSLQNGNAMLVFEVTNPNSSPLLCDGYTSESFKGGLKPGTISPLYEVKLLRDKTWKAHPIGWCGTGLGSVRIPAKAKVTFSCPPRDGTWDEMKVGLTWYGSAKRQAAAIAWSDPVKRSEIATKKP